MADRWQQGSPLGVVRASRLRSIVFHAQGWEDFTYWATADKKMLRRLLKLIEEAGWKRSNHDRTSAPHRLR
jgi:Txe/YoeB family toxin of Txe-Axe toxin-antitoxin module